MKIINIFPLKNMGFEARQSMHMYLTHLVEKSENYANIAKITPGYKILDNSLIEIGSALTLTRLLEAAKKIEADEIILPDVFRDGKATIESVKKSLEELEEIFPEGCPYKLMAVCHGRDIEEWKECYEYLLNESRIDVIGVPKVCAKMHPQGRAYFINNICKVEEKTHHLLGLWYTVKEFELYDPTKLSKIRSCDSCHMPFCTIYDLPYDATRPDGITVNLEEDEIVNEAKFLANAIKADALIEEIERKSM